MGFGTLLEVASMPILQVLLIGGLGAFMASKYCNLLPPDASNSINKIVFVVFTPALMFASLAKTVTLQDIISLWFMPINVGLTFFVGGTLGWISVKLLKPGLHLEGLVIACCSAANLGNLVLIIVPAICHEEGSPFGDHAVCSTVGLSYASFSMALGGFYIWTYTYHLVKTSAVKFKAIQAAEESLTSMEPNKDLEALSKTPLLTGEIEQNTDQKQSLLRKVVEVLHQILEELMAPPTLGAILGLVVGAVSGLKDLIIGDSAPLHVIQDSVKLLGDGMLPCLILILGGNLIKGLKSVKMKKSAITAVIVVKYVIMPVIGIGVVKAADKLGFLPSDPLYHFVLMLQFALPPAMSVGNRSPYFVKSIQSVVGTRCPMSFKDRPISQLIHQMLPLLVGWENA